MFPPADRDGEATLDPRLVKAIEHPARAQFLRLLARHQKLSPPQALAYLDKGSALANLLYNVWVLADLDLIEAAGDPEPDQGQPYKLTARGRQALAAMGINPDREV